MAINPKSDLPSPEEHKPTGLATFWAELKRRHVVRVGMVYAIVGWLVIQVANRLFVYNDKVSATRRFGKLEVQFIKVPSSRLGKFEEIRLNGEPSAFRRIASLPRIVFDAVYDYNRFGSMSRAFTWIGWILSSCGIDKKSLRTLRDNLRPTRSYIPVDPGKPSRGKINKEWGVLDNV